MHSAVNIGLPEGFCGKAEAPGTTNTGVRPMLQIHTYHEYAGFAHINYGIRTTSSPGCLAFWSIPIAATVFAFRLAIRI